MIKCYTLNRTQVINQSIDKVFSFFSKPENLEIITPKYLNFKIITPVPINMVVGQLIDYKLKIHSFPIKWTSLISHYDPPYSFVDEQVRGPYALWHHTHLFKEQENGTLIEDQIKYQIPFSIFGKLLNFTFIKRDLENIFNYREKTISRLFQLKSNENKGII